MTSLTPRERLALNLLFLHIIFCLLYAFYRLVTYNTQKLSDKQKIRKRKVDDAISEFRLLTDCADWVISLLFVVTISLKAFVAFSYVVPFINGIFTALGISKDEEEKKEPES